LGVAFYTDVITCNPYEEESDLEKTLDVLLDMKGPYGLCINKLFVLPGTPLAEQMRRDGKAIEDGARNELFGYYCRLFSVASLSQFSGWMVRMLQRFEILRRNPVMIHMPTLEFGFRVLNGLHRRALLVRSLWCPRAAGPSSSGTPPAGSADLQEKAAHQGLSQIQ
jgi:hypothetical protein